jgi:pimeloyl-ACP methyl ester carboxylesterase
MVEVGELSVRTLPAGGAVAGNVHIESGSVSPYGRRQIVVLIHGYANSQATASASFQTCIDNLQKLPAPASTNLPSPVFKFYWPGDTQIRIFSAASYPTEIGPAVESGRRLADFLGTLIGPDGSPTEIHLIAHSLGNRVALEMLNAFDATNQRVIFRSISMMAAAVPVSMVSNGGHLWNSWLIVSRCQALCSISDWVLHFAFPAGETAAREGFFPEAVGRFGNPSGTWNKNLPMSDYGHGSYWPNTATAPFLASFLEMPINPPILGNSISARPVAPPRMMQASGAAASRKTPSR